MIDSRNAHAHAENLDRLAGHSTRGDAFNIEFRFTDATASPYLAVSTIMRAGLEGIRAGLPAPVPVDRDPAELSGRERETPGLNALPASLEAAVDAFERDAAARSWFTPTMAKVYTALKRFEAEAFFRSTPKHMYERYALAY